MANSTPNILILFTDMQRADTIHALGNEIISTPHLDRLAREGVSFTSCYSPSPVCVGDNWDPVRRLHLIIVQDLDDLTTREHGVQFGVSDPRQETDGQAVGRGGYYKAAAHGRRL